MIANRSTKRGDARTETLATVWGLVAAGGVGAFSMREAADAADVSLGTVTYHFANRDRLVDEAFLALAERHEMIGAAAITSSRTQTRHDARNTLVYALHHLWGDRTITLTAAELRVHASRTATGKDAAARVAEIAHNVVDELHRVTDRPRGRRTITETTDLLDAAALRLAVRHQSPKEFRVAIRRRVNSLYT